MPIAGQRDPEETGATLTAWLRDQLPEAADVLVSNVVVPQSSGFSNETFLFDASWIEAGEERTSQFVLRAEPTGNKLFPHVDVLSQQHATMKRVGEVSDVPVPTMRWAEPEAEVLGTPFFVMDRIDGRVPPDSPPYVAEGFVLDLAPADRRTLSQNGLDAMCQVHAIDPLSVGGFEHLDKAAQGHGPPGPDQLKAYFAHYHQWALGDTAHPICEQAWQWLVERWPDDGDRLDLTWGDARMGNLMFAENGLACTGVFDWEMAAITNAESDLGWWIYMQNFHCYSSEVELPEGLLTADDAVARWQEQTGRTAEHVEFYTALGGYHFSLIMVAMATCVNAIAPGMMPDDFITNNPGPLLLAEMLNL